MRFATPILLIGLLAAAIPFVLHLLASIRAPKAPFPTLRLVKVSMERTARRRHVQHWLLLILRSVMLGLLAVAVAEPISRAGGFWQAGANRAAVLVLDNSLSMTARRGGSSRFEQARAAASALLSGDDKPTAAAVLLTNGGQTPTELTAELGALRRAVTRSRPAADWAPVAERVREALGLLHGQTRAHKTIWLFSDLQKVSFEDLVMLPRLARTEDVGLMIVNFGSEEADNVAVTELEVAGQPIVNSSLAVTATVSNSSPRAQVVDVSLHLDDQPTGQVRRQRLGPAGADSQTTTVTFRFRLVSSGPTTGAVVIDGQDDLPADDIRRFATTVSGRVRAVVVADSPPTDSAAVFDPAGMLTLALNPFEEELSPWSISTTVIRTDALSGQGLQGADAAFFCEIQRFSPAQAEAIVEFVRRGGAGMFFLGPGVSAENYNQRFIDEAAPGKGLLPARIGQAVGQVGPDAPAVPTDWINIEHPYLAGLYDEAADYGEVLVQRYVRLEAASESADVLMRLAGGDPLIIDKAFGAGRVTLCAVPASPRWSDLPIHHLFLPMVVRMSLLARRDLARDEAYTAGAHVEIRPTVRGPGTEEAVLKVVPPNAAPAEVATMKLGASEEGPVATFAETSQPGVYRWYVASPGRLEGDAEGAFVVNPVGSESDLRSFSPEDLRAALAQRGGQRVIVASSVEAARAQAAAQAEGTNWWDVLLVAVICVLIAEAVVANRLRAPAGGVSLVPPAATT